MHTSSLSGEGQSLCEHTSSLSGEGQSLCEHTSSLSGEGQSLCELTCSHELVKSWQFLHKTDSWRQSEVQWSCLTGSSFFLFPVTSPFGQPPNLSSPACEGALYIAF